MRAQDKAAQCKTGLLSFVIKKTLLAAAIVIASLTGTQSPVAAQEWRALQPMDTGRARAGVATVDGEIYVAGGSGLTGPEDAFEVLDPIGEHWRPLPAMPSGREHFGMAAIGKQLYVVGGFTSSSNNQPTRSMQIFDTVNQNWRSGPNMPGVRSGHAVVSHSGKLYVMGGRGTSPQDVYVYDPSKNQWRISTVKLSVARESMAAIVNKGRIFLIGGRGLSGQATGRVESWDPSGGQWRRHKDLPVPRSGLTAASVAGRIHVAGGESLKPLRTYDNHDVYNASSNAWARGKKLSSPRQGLVSAAIGDKWYIIGGGAGAGFLTVFTPTDVVEVYGP